MSQLEPNFLHADGDWRIRLSGSAWWRYTVALSPRSYQQHCKKCIVLTGNNNSLWPIEWMRYWIQLMFHSGRKWVVLKTQWIWELDHLMSRSSEKSGLLDRHQQFKLTFVSNGANIPTSAFIPQVEEKKSIFQWDRVNNFGQTVNTMAYERKASSKMKPTTKRNRQPSSY